MGKEEEVLRRQTQRAEDKDLMLKTNTCTGTPTLPCQCKEMHHWKVLHTLNIKSLTDNPDMSSEQTGIAAQLISLVSHSKPVAQRLAAAQQSWPQHCSIHRSDLLQVAITQFFLYHHKKCQS